MKGRGLAIDNAPNNGMQATGKKPPAPDAGRWASKRCDVRIRPMATRA